ncbi:hypothetical protein Xen7305DRAFT_00029040 [Xenococcus sp. PCC 7305]|uniref:hypothetical protein n=1 Tax=Xenococcus sp. PCC 7305 TaxID=102125 RepID=UPI0002AC3F66|nr:hypothetical protein [Xenococcus sp. PCC 7305]ELS03184.1 hypothetical protein Xen7305DRAFT_00029040 [Xenococcus sp. PCC 7305]
MTDNQSSTINIFSISPLIRITLLLLYAALTIPLPFLAEATAAQVPSNFLSVGIGLGAIVVYAALSQQVILDEEKIQVTYPSWIPKFFYQRWFLNWNQIAGLKMRTTGQGGLVYYFITVERDKAYLLPMRIAGFAKMVTIVEEKTGIDTTDVRPLAQPWMYLILLGFTLVLLLIDFWTISTASSLL